MLCKVGGASAALLAPDRARKLILTSLRDSAVAMEVGSTLNV